MNITESIIKFDGYRVIKSNFEITNENLEDGTGIKITPTYSRSIKKISDKNYVLELGILISPTDNNPNVPFKIEIIIEGIFNIGDSDSADEIMNVNATAILFPYLRSTLSLFMTTMNINPIILPVINLVKMFEETNNITEEND